MGEIMITVLAIFLGLLIGYPLGMVYSFWAKRRQLLQVIALMKELNAMADCPPAPEEN